MIIISLIWPQSESYTYFYPKFLYFNLFQGTVLFFQNQYQRKRHYVALTLGKAKDIDMPSSETITEMPVDLVLLIPSLYAVYCAEMYVAYLCLLFSYTHRFDDNDNGIVQLFFIGLGFLVLSIGNAFTTSNVLLKKGKKCYPKLTRRESIDNKKK